MHEHLAECESLLKQCLNLMTATKFGKYGQMEQEWWDQIEVKCLVGEIKHCLGNPIFKRRDLDEQEKSEGEAEEG